MMPSSGICGHHIHICIYTRQRERKRSGVGYQKQAEASSGLALRVGDTSIAGMCAFLDLGTVNFLNPNTGWVGMMVCFNQQFAGFRLTQRLWAWLWRVVLSALPEAGRPTHCACWYFLAGIPDWTEKGIGAAACIQPCFLTVDQGKKPLQVLTALIECPLNCEISPSSRKSLGVRISSQRLEEKQDSWSMPSLQGGLGRESAWTDWNAPLWSQQEDIARQISLPFTHRQCQCWRGFILTNHEKHTPYRWLFFFLSLPVGGEAIKGRMGLSSVTTEASEDG